MIGALMSRGKARGVGFAGPRLDRQRGRSVGRRDLRLRPSTIPTSTAICCSSKVDPQFGGAARVRARRCGARQAGRRLQARPLVGRARARRHPYRRARRRGRCGERVPRRLRHRAGRKPRRRCSRRCRWCGARRSGRSARVRRASRCSPPRRAAPSWWSIRSRCAASRSRSRARRPSRASPPRASTVTPARIVDLTVAGARYDVIQGRARHPHHRARIRHGAGGGRLLGALPAGAGGAADHRQRERRQADRGVSRARSAGGAGDAQRGRRAELPHAGSLRRRHRGGAARGASRSRRLRRRQRPAMAACSTSWKPTRCSTGSACRARPRSRSMRRSRRRPPCPSRYPVAVKVLSADIPHKTEAGGVALNVRDGDALVAAIKAMRETVQAAHRHHAGARAGRADDLRHRRGADRLSRRPRGRAADHGGGRRRLHRNLSRPQPAPRAGRSRRPRMR